MPLPPRPATVSMQYNAPATSRPREQYTSPHVRPSRSHPRSTRVRRGGRVYGVRHRSRLIGRPTTSFTRAERVADSASFAACLGMARSRGSGGWHTALGSTPQWSLAGCGKTRGSTAPAAPRHVEPRESRHVDRANRCRQKPNRRGPTAPELRKFDRSDTSYNRHYERGGSLDGDDRADVHRCVQPA